MDQSLPAVTLSQLVPGQRVRYRLLDGSLRQGGYLLSARHYGYVVLTATPDGKGRCWTVATEAVKEWFPQETRVAPRDNGAQEAQPIGSEEPCSTVEEEYESALRQQHLEFENLVSSLERRSRARTEAKGALATPTTPMAP